MSTQRTFWPILVLLAAVLIAVGGARAQDELVVRTSSAIDSSLLARHHLSVLAVDGKRNLYRLRTAPGASGAALSAALGGESSVVTAELNSRTSLPAPVKLDQSTVSVLNQSTVSVLNQRAVSGLSQSTVSVLNALVDMRSAQFYGSTVISGYVNQPAMRIIQNDAAHKISTGIGVVIADISNGVDPNHPVLRGALMPGFNFLSNSNDISVFAGLNQSTVSVLNENADLNQSTVSVLNQSTVSVLNQSTVSVLNGLPAMFGHGTGVAGILRLVAPQAKIMPLRAFSLDGNGQMYDVIRAIYYAADQGADVINMSFSCDCDSKGLKDAIAYADRQGVVMVASVGNDSSRVPLFPAAYLTVLGVAATNFDDSRAAFSNYGSAVSVAAPGTGIITAFPGGKYAAFWGTSFSSPQVAGEAALLMQRGFRGYWVDWSILRSADEVESKGAGLGYGRIDLLQALSGN
ncbi:MAG: S8 family serine peptidase [Acidobacteria bacterium]|jgi:subtilisin family serine protease|nr:S8 family serine peptidase [Acidobacteriota bacterium]